MRPLSIYLADPTYTTVCLAIETMPLNIGYIAAYCRQQFGLAVTIKLFKYLDDLDAAVHDTPPDVIGLSNYPWNFNAGIEIFRQLKNSSPATLRVMGGPNIPRATEDRDALISRYREIDFYAYQEGERAFAELVRRILDCGTDRKKLKTEPVPGMLFGGDEGPVVVGEPMPRETDLDSLPSPYLSGVLDGFFDGKLTPLVETNRGCPFSCSFCRDGDASMNTINYFSRERVEEELSFIADRASPAVANVMFADLNFAMYERDLDICRYLADMRKEKGWPSRVEATMGKNKKQRVAEASKILEGALNLQLSVQSLDDEVLRSIKRENISTNELLALGKEFKEAGISTTSELIMGMPSGSYRSHAQSIAKLIQAGVTRITTYSAMLLNGAEMASTVCRKQYGLRSHWRVLNRNMGKLRNGQIVVETEEIVTSSDTLSFADYKKARSLGLIVNVVYNCCAFEPLFLFMGQEQMPVFEIITRLCERIDMAPGSVRDVIASFERHTVDELWDSREEIIDYYRKPENYEKLVAGERGINVMQVHVAESIFIMPAWCKYTFAVCRDILENQGKPPELINMLDELERYCLARCLNVVSIEGQQQNLVETFDYDIEEWYGGQASVPLKEFVRADPVRYQFELTSEQIEIFNAFVARFGNSPTAIGRIVSNFLDPTKIWRIAVAKS